MLTLNEIANVSFRKSNFAGYKPEDVDEFIDKVVESYDLLIKKNIEQKELNEQLTAENERLKASLKAAPQQTAAPAPVQQSVAPEDVKLSEECEYTQEEIKNALLSAQKLANATIREARMKAEGMISEANAKAERIVGAAQSEANEQRTELDRLKKLVSDFRASLLDSYKEHLKLVNALPTQQRLGTPVMPEASAPTVKMPVIEEPVKIAEEVKEPVKEEVKEIVEEEISHTRSFNLGGGKKKKNRDNSDLKFGADYDVTKD